MTLYGRESIFRIFGGGGRGVFCSQKKISRDNNTIHMCSVAHPTYFARRHRKITDLFLTYWATQKWFLTHPRFMCKAKNDISSTCASVSHMSNSFLGWQRHSDLVVMCLQLDQKKWCSAYLKSLWLYLQRSWTRQYAACLHSLFMFLVSRVELQS